MGDNVLPAAFQSVALAVHLQDVHVVGETVEQRSGAAFRAKDLGPLVAGQVGGHHYGAPLVALAEDLEEQFRSGGGQGDEAGLCANLSSALSLRTRYHWPVADAFHLYQVVEKKSGLSWSTPGLLPVLLGSPQVRMAYPTVTHTDMAMSAWFIAGVGTGRLPLLAFSGQKAVNAFG